MITKLFVFCLPLRRNRFLQTLSHSRSNFSILADSNVTNSNASLQNLFLHFVTNRFNISSADAAKMLKMNPSLGRLKTLDTVEQFTCMLVRHGCTEDQIAKIIISHPFLLTESADRLLEPKIQLLKDFGVGGEDLIKIVALLPRILTNKLEALRFNLELLKIIFPTHDLLNRAIRRNCHILGKSLQNSLKPSVAFWEDFGFRGTELTMFLLVNPWLLTRTSLSPEQLDLIRRIGVPKESKMYKYVVRVVALSRIEVLEARLHNLQLCGLSPEQTLKLVRASPVVLELYEENIKKKMDFMRNHMELCGDLLVKRPRLLTMSLAKVIRPRLLVLQTMKSMNGAENLNPKRLVSIFNMTEAQFVAQVIQGHRESAALQTVYKNAIVIVSKEVC